MKRTSAMTVLAVVLLASGCGGPSHKATATGAPTSAAGSMSGAFSETPSPGGKRSSSADSGTSGEAIASDAAGAPSLGATGGDGSASSATTAGGPAAPDQPALGLRAGKVDDNDRFADYLAYRTTFEKTGAQVHDLDVSERHVFRVTDKEGKPVVGADVLIRTGQTTVAEVRTMADGRALWFPRATTAAGSATTFTATVSRGATTAGTTVDRAQLDHAVTLDVPAAEGPLAVDVEFLMDATGSMGDEIERLDAAVSTIASRVAALPSHPDLRFGLTAFRDRGDDFLTRTWNFTGDVAEFQKTVGELRADGGGDTPEDVQQGLHDAITKPSWRDPGTVKLLFLIGDAAPHLDYQGGPNYADDILDASRRGITIQSLAASGLDDQGEFVWRQLAQVTLGQFLFLTYGADGSTPGDTTTHHVDGFVPTGLDDLVVGIIEQQVIAASGASKGQ